MRVSTSRFANVWSQIKQIKNNFHPLDVVGRGSETQLQVGENLNDLIDRAKTLGRHWVDVSC